MFTKFAKIGLVCFGFCVVFAPGHTSVGSTPAPGGGVGVTHTSSSGNTTTYVGVNSVSSDSVTVGFGVTHRIDDRK